MTKKGKLIKIDGPYQFDRERVLVDVKNEAEQVIYAELGYELKISIEAQVIPELIDRLKGAYKEYVRRKSEWKKK
jgi:hypothetical protein